MRWSLAMSAHSQLIDKYVAGVQALRDAVKGMSPDQLRARPIAGKWSTQEVVCHLSDFDPILADRIKRVISHDNPTLLGADENLFAATLAYHERNVEEELNLIEKTRKQLAFILRQLPDAAFQRIGTHNERGAFSLEKWLTIAANHIPHHVQFIMDKRRALGLA
jgi:uncharacterized damage-inducible protein DinB